MSTVPSITVAWGDGIGPEIMDASLHILREAGAQFEVERVIAGEQMYLAGNQSGLSEDFWESIKRTRVFFKGPLTTPQGGGYKSVNVTVRKTLGLFANVRPSRSLYPMVPTKHPKMDLVVIRENEEDLYGGIEHQQTDEVVQCLKLISRPGTERIVRYAFEYARANGRKRVTCLTKDNIMKMTDGLFHRIFREMAPEYPDIETDHLIIDIGTARVADTPEIFDVLLLPNLYGDIVSDVTAQLTGSVGLGGSANVGEHAALFEAIHGSAPMIAGQGIANPSGLLLGGVMMMVHIGQAAVAERVHNAWLATLEQGIHTGDIYREGQSSKLVGTKEFADAVVANLGKMPHTLAPVSYGNAAPLKIQPVSVTVPAKRTLVGVDVFVGWAEQDRNPDALAALLQQGQGAGGLALTMVSNRGQKVWPNGMPETFCTDHWRCRFQAPGQAPVTAHDVLALQAALVAVGLEPIKTENLYLFDGKPGFSKGQGE